MPLDNDKLTKRAFDFWHLSPTKTRAEKRVGPLLHSRDCNSENKFTAAISGKERGVLFYQGHDDLDSYEYLIEFLPSLAHNKTKPLKHLFLEFPSIFQERFNDLNTIKDEDEKDKCLNELEEIFMEFKQIFYSPRAAELNFRLIKEAVKNGVKVFAVDEEATTWLRAILPDEVSFEISNNTMVEGIKQYNRGLGAEESYIGLFGLLHRGMGNQLDCNNWAFLPRNNLKQDVELAQVTPENLKDKLEGEPDDVATYQQYLSQCNNILVTRPVNVEKGVEESQMFEDKRQATINVTASRLPLLKAAVKYLFDAKLGILKNITVLMKLYQDPNLFTAFAKGLEALNSKHQLTQDAFDLWHEQVYGKAIAESEVESSNSPTFVI